MTAGSSKVRPDEAAPEPIRVGVLHSPVFETAGAAYREGPEQRMGTFAATLMSANMKGALQPTQTVNPVGITTEHDGQV